MSAPHGSRLTPMQRELFDREPGIAQEAAAAAWKAAGPRRWRHLTFDEVLSVSTIAAMEATRTYDPAKAPTYRSWAFFSAVHAVLHAGRDARTQYAKEKALFRATVLQHFATTGEDIVLGWDTEEAIEGRLHSFSDSVLEVAMKIVASVVPAASDEERLAEHEAAAQAGDALREVLPAPGSAERTMIELRFTRQMPLKEVAQVMGIEPSGYKSFGRRFHELLSAIRVALMQRGINEMPPWLDDVSGQALGDSG